jgi:biotin carboxylase
MFFEKSYIDKTSKIPCFILNKDYPIKNEVKRFQEFCKKHIIKIDYFYNDSEYNQELIQKFASLLKLEGSLNDNQALCVRDKVIMKDMLQEIGYRTMSYEKLTSTKEVTSFAKKCGGFPVIVKWRRGLSSKEVYKINNIKQLDNLGLDYSTGRYIVEEYCPHLIWCIDSLIQDGKVIATFPAWLPYTNLSFAEKKEKFAQITVNKNLKEFKFNGSKITQNIVNELNLKNGYMHLEAFVDSFGQPIICEFAWRTPGEHMLSNHSIAFGIDVYSLLIDIMIGKKIKSLKIKGKKCVGDMFLPLTDGEVLKISSYDKIKKLKGVIDGEIIYKVGDMVQTKRQYTSCAGWVQVIGKTKDEVLERMLTVYKNFEIKTKNNNLK